MGTWRKGGGEWGREGMMGKWSQEQSKEQERARARLSISLQGYSHIHARCTSFQSIKETESAWMSTSAESDNENECFTHFIQQEEKLKF